MRNPGAPVDNLTNQDLLAVIRIGSDFINNFYEVRIPLKVTPWGLRSTPTSGRIPIT